MATGPPDVVLFMTDQQRHDQVGFSSGGFFQTPRLDALAARGVVFEQAYSASTVCVPARTALLTGAHPHRSETQGSIRALREGSWSLPLALRAKGYQTALIGKMHFSPIHADHGFDVMRTCEHVSATDIGTRANGDLDLDDYHDWLIDSGLTEYRQVPDEVARSGNCDKRHFPYDAACHPTEWVGREALRVLTERDPSRALFLVVSFPHPHAPLDPPEPFASTYDPADVVLPTDGFDVNDQLPEPFRLAMQPTKARHRPRLSSDHDAMALRRRFTRVRALVHHIDVVMGRVLDAIDLDDTYVFFTSDHGDYAGHRGLLQKVPWIPFDDLLRVPLVAVGPGIEPGRSTADLVQSFDLVPTICEIAGIETTAAEFDAHTLSTSFGGERSRPADDRTVAFGTDIGWPGSRRGSFKYVRHQRTGQAVLFDLDADPGETHNLMSSARHRDVAFDLAVGLQMTLERSTFTPPTAFA